MHLGKLALAAMAVSLSFVAPQAAHAQNTVSLDNTTCVTCHNELDFAKSVHGAQSCTACHTAITQVPHNLPATTLTERRQQISTICGSCHTDALNDYRNSVHGRQGVGGGNVNVAVCTDCHTAHAVADPSSATSRITITKQCGACHAEAMASYTETYHGQLYALGYAETATCSDCHGGHAILPASDVGSSVSQANVLGTCRNCHEDATAGFASFQPHATTDDFHQYPYTWLAAKACWAMIFGVFGVCWLHSALWLYRELRDRRQRKLRPHISAQALEGVDTREYTRWNLGWRFAHLVFVVSVIVLVMTGIPALYPNTIWAPVLERMLGGPVVISVTHRVAAVVMTGGFIIHFACVGFYLVRHWRTVSWFGPHSLLPTLQDGRDLWAMIKWFVGIARRPTFDHWSYPQKLDYWGSFSGVALLTATGAVLWFKVFTATYLPGWVLNVASVIHGHEALFASGYLFIVHYFVNHWRPDKFPLDLVMFTGSIPLDEFKREYGVEYARLTAAGELEQYLVEAPSKPMKLGAKALGLGLVAVSLLLLVLMVNGLVDSL